MLGKFLSASFLTLRASAFFVGFSIPLPGFDVDAQSICALLLFAESWREYFSALSLWCVSSSLLHEPNRSWASSLLHDASRPRALFHDVEFLCLNPLVSLSLRGRPLPWAWGCFSSFTHLLLSDLSHSYALTFRFSCLQLGIFLMVSTFSTPTSITPPRRERLNGAATLLIPS